MASSATIGEFMQSLSEMGFTENQIQAAFQAGCFSVPEAAEWIVRAGSPRHTLTPRSGPTTSAISAFNPPKDAPGAETGGKAADLVLHHPVAESEPIRSRIKQNNDFLAQERQRAAEHARAERRQNTQERELILKRIAENRRAQQEKQTVTPSASEREKTSERVQDSTDNKCILMIRLPTGESLRLCFPADAPLQAVVDHVTSLHSSLPSFTLFHGFPRRRFSDNDMSLTLHSLGLTPNAALVLQAITPPDPSIPTPAPNPEPPRSDPPALQVADELVQPVAPPHFHPIRWDDMVQAGIAEPRHRWGRGQRMVQGEDPDDGDDANPDADEEQALADINAIPRLPFFNELREQDQHYWPDQGNRLGNPDALVDPAEGRVLPGEAALQRLQRNDQQRHHHTESLIPHKKPCTVPRLITMATQAAISLISAPSMQFVSSFSCLTPELAERLLGHMTADRALTPRTLQLFIGCSLRTLTLNSYPYTTNTLLQQLSTFTHLTHLSLVNSPLITDCGLSVLCKLVKLQYLNLSSCSKLTDGCLHHMKTLRSLCVLILDHTKVSDAGLLVFLQTCPPALVHLSLNQTAVTEETLTALRVCVPQLRLLSITHTKVCDVSTLTDLHELQTLHLDFTQVKEESLRCLSAHRTLTSLSLHGVPVSSGDHTLEILSGLNLTQLTLPGRHSVTDAGLFFLCGHALLSELDLSDYTHITDQGITQLGKMTRLKKLSLSNTPLTDVGLTALSTLTLLMDLCLNRTAVTSRGVTEFITHLPYLQVLGLSCTQVGDSVLKALIRCTELIKLNLSKTRITDRGLKFLHGKKLSQVNLDGTGVTAGGVANLISASPHLISIRANNTRPLPPEQQSDDDEGNDEARP
ncbi:uncharacterized protein si:ch73-173p19.1 isoform X2 [Silurus meridionalis]|uniref:UBX domain-containing protein n=1 Tax=Silurus meridionalis TaxID=175797 RepID=A0A8T0AJC9_SILME|nr:uncharacterized protein si:ch73-173p19.1 isoform X2 [Silurus meridionalis]KAF7691733.1 hypothetical protein HF521_010700 [Silurus meridionalis]KAI5092142.1 hypothetical protein C0J45_17773 [Silurus meridionalis]